MTWEEQTIGSLEWSEKNIKKLDRSRQSSLALFIASPQLRILYVMNLIYFVRKTDIFMFKLAVSNSFFVKKLVEKLTSSVCQDASCSVSLFSPSLELLLCSSATSVFGCYFSVTISFISYLLNYSSCISQVMLRQVSENFSSGTEIWNIYSLQGWTFWYLPECSVCCPVLGSCTVTFNTYFSGNFALAAVEWNMVEKLIPISSTQ